MKDDISLIDEYLGGSEEAVEEIVRRYQKMIYSFAYRMVNDMEEAKDITQKTFIQAIEGLKGFRRKASFKTWIYKIAYNISLNHIRKRHREVEIDGSVAINQTGALSLMIEEEKNTLIKKGLNALPKQQRLAIILRAYEGLCCREAAGIMGCSESAMKSQYHFGVKRLKDALSDIPDQPVKKGE